MYTIYIELDLNKIPKESAADMLNEHRAWFKTYFDAGKFLVVGPCPDVPGSGLIIAQGTKEEMEQIITSDVYYTDKLATYTIREYKPTMFNENIKNYIS